jgi:hypothetical protein
VVNADRAYMGRAIPASLGGGLSMSRPGREFTPVVPADGARGKSHQPRRPSPHRSNFQDRWAPPGLPFAAQAALATGSRPLGIDGGRCRGSGSRPLSRDGRVSPRRSLAASGARTGPRLPIFRPHPRGGLSQTAGWLRIPPWPRSRLLARHGAK